MSKKIIFAMFLVLFFLSVSSVVIAQDMKILSPDSTVIIYAGKTNEIKIPIKNEGVVSDTVYVSIWPAQWVNLEKYWLTIEPGDSELISLFITPPEDIEEGINIFTITTQSLNTNKTTTNSLFLNVKRETDVFISEIKLNRELIKPGETLEIESVLTNLHKTQKHKVFLTTKILDNEGKLIKKFDENIELSPKTVKTIKNFYEVNELQKYGKCSVEVELKDSLNKFLDKEKDDFEIQKHFKMTEYKIREYGLFYTAIVVEITNEGNVPDSNYTIQESLPKITKYFFYPETEPGKEEEKDNRMLYTWEIQGLDPGQTKIIRYKLRFVNALITTLVLSFLLFLVYEYITKPMLKKGYYGFLSGEEELKISLNVKNRKRRTLKNVIVKDVVPPIAKVVRKFDTRIPEIKLKSSGTELVWKIDKLKPGEEVLLTYKIKPLIDVIGKLTLPKSYLTYKGKVRREKRVVSKSVSITGKIK